MWHDNVEIVSTCEVTIEKFNDKTSNYVLSTLKLNNDYEYVIIFTNMNKEIITLCHIFVSYKDYE